MYRGPEQRACEHNADRHRIFQYPVAHIVGAGEIQSCSVGHYAAGCASHYRRAHGAVCGVLALGQLTQIAVDAEGLADGGILTRDRFHSGQLLYHLARVGAQHRYVIGWEMQPLFVFPRKGGHRQLGYVKLAQERPMLCEIFLPADDVKIVEKII